MKKSQNMTDLENLAASQWGLFTTAQAQGFHLLRNQVSRMVDSGKVEPMGYGVYRFTAGAETGFAEIKAAWLLVYPKEFAYDRLRKRPYDAVVAGRTAAAMHDIGDFYASPYTFAVSERKQTNRDDMRYLQRSIDDKDIVFIDDLPVTSVERTVADLVKSGEDPDHVDKLMRDASGKSGHVFDRARLSELLSPLASRNGYEKRDGESFAADLISRNAAGNQMENAERALTQALESIYSREEMQQIQDQMLAIVKELVPEDVFKNRQEAAEQIAAIYAAEVKALGSHMGAKAPIEMRDVEGAMTALKGIVIAAALQGDDDRERIISQASDVMARIRRESGGNEQ